MIWNLIFWFLNFQDYPIKVTSILLFQKFVPRSNMSRDKVERGTNRLGLIDQYDVTWNIVSIKFQFLFLSIQTLLMWWFDKFFCRIVFVFCAPYTVYSFDLTRLNSSWEFRIHSDSKQSKVYWIVWRKIDTKNTLKSQNQQQYGNL